MKHREKGLYSACCLIAACFLPSHAMAKDCFDATIERSIPEALSCMHERIELWNDNVYGSYQMALDVAKSWDEQGILGKRNARQELQQSQDAWLKYSQHTCNMVTLPYHGQDRQTIDLVKYSCVEQHLKRRNEELRQTFEQN
ncbi:MAG: lysozyme inhibitor LprI family protein [Cohaesibacter sp.]|nr:lysozyme inhibitor LprI family protein [Cohaesibacter sp.]